MSIEAACNIDMLRTAAKQYLPRLVFDYIDGGAEDEICMRHNREAYEAVKLLPNYLVDVSAVDQSTTLFGRTYKSSFGIGPTGLAAFARPGADLLLAQAAAEADIPFVLSGAGTASVEAVCKLAPKNTWYQLYVARDAAITADLLRRARDAGVEVLVLTVDVPVHSKRERDIRNGFVPPVKPNLAMLIDMLSHPAWLLNFFRHGMPRFENWAPYASQQVGKAANAQQIADFFTAQIPFTQTWRELEALRRLWPGKLIVKGIMSGGDAQRAMQAGADGLLLSNHGGRAFDSAPSPLELLPAIRASVGNLPLLLDSGIRRGSDIIKARALGADFAFVGRPTLYGVAAGGLAGAQKAVAILHHEIELALAQMGRPVLAELGGDVLFSR